MRSSAPDAAPRHGRRPARVHRGAERKKRRWQEGAGGAPKRNGGQGKEQCGSSQVTCQAHVRAHAARDLLSRRRGAGGRLRCEQRRDHSGRGRGCGHARGREVGEMLKSRWPPRAPSQAFTSVCSHLCLFTPLVFTPLFAPRAPSQAHAASCAVTRLRRPPAGAAAAARLPYEEAAAVGVRCCSVRCGTESVRAAGVKRRYGHGV